MKRLLDVLTAALCLAVVASFPYFFYRVLTSPSRPAETVIEQQSITPAAYLTVAEVQEAPESKPGPFFISAFLLHQACASKQSQCVIYMYGVLDMLFNSMACELNEQASKDTAQATLSSLGRLHSSMSDAELQAANAAEMVAMAFVTTPAFQICMASANAPKESL